MEMVNSKLFTAQQIETLRAEYSTIKTIDPCGAAYKKMTALFDKADKETIRQLSTANIPFLSRLALNRVAR
jgi:hypothetical protein